MSKNEEILLTAAGYAELEEELGIDLITLFKAMTYHGIWEKGNGSVLTPFLYFSNFNGKHHLFGSGVEWDKRYYLKDYGKTWALTKDGLK